MRSWIPIVLVALALSGCYQSHPFLYVDGLPDAGPGPDARPFDTGPPPLDTGPPPIDTGPPPFDTGPPPIDTGPPPFDTGPPPIDTGPPPLDVGPPPFDTGPPPVDSGPRDSGFIDSGFIDSGPRDSGPPPADTGILDSGPRDSGPPDAGLLDAGPDRPALRFNAGTLFFVGDAPTFDLAGHSTFELWVRSRESESAVYCSKGDVMARDLIFGQRGNRFITGWAVGLEQYLLEGPEVPRDRWVHLAVVRRTNLDGTHNVLFLVDGVPVARAPALARLTDSFNDLPFRCGFGDLDVDEVRLWRVARAESDIVASMNNRISGAIPGLQSYWRLDERSQILTDYTAMGRVGILGRLTTPDPADALWIGDGPF